MRTNQLVLLQTTPDRRPRRTGRRSELSADFRIDEQTRTLGREGIAAAREALRRATERSAA